ncbi:hypothetical protein BO78DRAFT_444102 [Aspergillus sclerotiicarbonarius CBS 121057]|uniref:Uncharacterized protein n=1 Tax=Aspergillus sclerotiicarbonarius (strain CBS 121057 / IBT 28362) TaxID=1448318 RepID=A0A319EQ96_ASPSB|nr:hypothetical protein BO78DRAFT_444102 [Aspergillus sclerotiicarbonarius CBS 121057]
MPDRFKRRVLVTLHYRDELSLGANRMQLGHAAYHWGILVTPKVSQGRDCYSFNVSNGVDLDPVARANRNPNFDWVLRARTDANPLLSSHLLGRIMIGKVSHDVSFKRLESLLRSIPLPRKGVEENCVTWTRTAIRKLQAKGWAEGFNIDRFMDDSLAYAHQRMDNNNSKEIINYTSRPM